MRRSQFELARDEYAGRPGKRLLTWLPVNARTRVPNLPTLSSRPLCFLSSLLSFIVAFCLPVLVFIFKCDLVLYPFWPGLVFRFSNFECWISRVDSFFCFILSPVSINSFLAIIINCHHLIFSRFDIFGSFCFSLLLDLRLMAGEGHEKETHVSLFIVTVDIVSLHKDDLAKIPIARNVNI